MPCYRLPGNKLLNAFRHAGVLAASSASGSTGARFLPSILIARCRAHSRLPALEGGWTLLPCAVVAEAARCREKIELDLGRVGGGVIGEAEVFAAWFSFVIWLRLSALAVVDRESGTEKALLPPPPMNSLGLLQPSPVIPNVSLVTLSSSCPALGRMRRTIRSLRTMALVTTRGQ